MYEAARITDQIAHTRWGFGIGLAAGAIVGTVVGAAILTVGAPLAATGIGAVVVFSVASIVGGAVGGAVAGAIGTIRNNAGPILTGAHSVKIGRLQAARAVVDTVGCDNGKVIAEGAQRVAIEGFPAARLGDKTQCGGTISQGYATVRIGMAPTAWIEVKSEIPKEIRFALGLLSVAGGLAQIKGFRLYRAYANKLATSKANLIRARAARDALAADLKSQKYKPATVTGGYNTETGEVAAAQSGGGLCAEDNVVQKLGGDPSKVKFTEAVRPRKLNSADPEVPVCTRCESTYGREPFPKGTTFQSDLTK